MAEFLAFGWPINYTTPSGHSVNDVIPSDSYLGDAYKLRLPGIDRLVEFILQKGRGSLNFKKDLR